MRTTWFDVHLDLPAFLHHRTGCQNVIDSPALVLIERAGFQVIPERELLAIGIKLAEDVCESPRQRLLICTTDLFMKANVAKMLLRTMDIDRFRRHIHV